MCKEKQPVPFFSKEASMYYDADEKGEYSFNKRKAWTTFRRALLILLITIVLTFTFEQAFLAGINAGVIASIFLTCLLWTSLFFYFFHGQKLGFKELGGMSLIVGSILLITLTPKEVKKPTAGTVELDTSSNKILAFVLAILMGIIFSGLAIDYHYQKSSGLPPLSVNIDCGLILSFVYLPLFIWQVNKVDTKIDYKSILLSNAQYISMLSGMINMSLAFNFGKSKAGLIQALEALKTIWQLLLTIAIQGLYPTPYEIGGVVLGMIGLFVIICQPKKQDK